MRERVGSAHFLRWAWEMVLGTICREGHFHVEMLQSVPSPATLLPDYISTVPFMEGVLPTLHVLPSSLRTLATTLPPPHADQLHAPSSTPFALVSRNIGSSTPSQRSGHHHTTIVKTQTMPHRPHPHDITLDLPPTLQTQWTPSEPSTSPPPAPSSTPK